MTRRLCVHPKPQGIQRSPDRMYSSKGVGQNAVGGTCRKWLGELRRLDECSCRLHLGTYESLRNLGVSVDDGDRISVVRTAAGSLSTNCNPNGSFQ